MKNKEIDFEKSLKKLDEIIEKISSQSSTIDESLKMYEEAKSIINELQNALDEVKGKIETVLK